MNELNKPLTLQEAADQIKTSRSRLWRAMSDGHLSVEKRRVGGRSVWTVLESDLAKWADEFLDATEPSPIVGTANTYEQSPEYSRTVVDSRKHHFERPRTTMNNHEQSRLNMNEQSSHPPVELYLALVDRLQRAERRTVELELTLQQSQRLLCENAESITEREARAKQAEAIVEHHQQREQELAAENARILGELEATRLQLTEAQKPSGFFSWLGLRRNRTAGAPVEKAV
jgi:hypothetical protein